MSLGENRGDFGVGVGARSLWEEGREQFLVFQEHHLPAAQHPHCQHQPNTSPAAWQELPWVVVVFLGCPNPCCVGLLSVLTQQFILRDGLSPSSKHPNFPREPPQAGILPWMLPGRELGSSQTFSPPLPLQKPGVSCCSKLPRGFQGCQEMIPELLNRSVALKEWAGKAAKVGLGGDSCSVLVLGHKILGGSLQVAGIPRSGVGPGSTVPPLPVVAAGKSWECSHLLGNSHFLPAGVGFVPQVS